MYLMHYNHNHDAHGRFSKSGSSHAISKLSRLDRKGNKQWLKESKSSRHKNIVGKKYHSIKKNYYNNRANRYANKISTKYKYISEDKLSARKRYIGQKYMLEFIK